MRKFVKQVHKVHIKYPFIDPLINLLLGAFIGTFIGDFVPDLNQSWHFWNSPSFWTCLFSIAIAVVYFSKFSTYSNSKNNRIKSAIQDFNETLINIATEELTKSTSMEELIRRSEMIRPHIETIKRTEDE